MTDCDRIVSLLSLYLEGETSPAEAAQIRGHLKACDECRSEYADMKATVELVRGLPQIQVSEGFESGVLARLRSAGVTEVGAHSGRRETDTRYEEDLVPAGPRRAVVFEADWGRENWWEGWLPRFAAAAAAAAVVAISMVGSHEFAQRQKAARDAMVARVPVTEAARVGSSDVASLDGGGTPGNVSTPGNGSTSGNGVATRNPQYDDLRSRFPDIPAEVIRAMPLNGETYAADRMVVQPWSSAAGGQLLAPVDFHGEEKVYIYR